MNYSSKIVVMLSITLLTSSALYSATKQNGDINVTLNVRSISNGIDEMLSGQTLMSCACLIGWNSATNNFGNGFFDGSTMRDRYIMSSIIAGVVTKVIKKSMSADSYGKLPSPLQVLLSNPFLASDVILKAIFTREVIKNNPIPYAAEVALLALQWVDKHWNY